MKSVTGILALVLLLLIAACAPAPMGGGETGTGFGPVAAKGRITGFGSVFVNGVEYETSGSQFSLDDNPGSENELMIGMVVTVHGSINADGSTGAASYISFSDELEGVVTLNDIAGSSKLVVMGQNVFVDGSTVYSNSTGDITYDLIDSVAANHIVEVSGFSAGNGDIYASRVELKKIVLGANDEIELKGIVNAVNTTAKTFNIGLQEISYALAELKNLTEAALLAGDGSLYVEVKAASYAASLPAASVEPEGDGKLGISGNDGDSLELEGVITGVNNPAGTLTINGQQVIMPAGFDFTSVLAGHKFEVEGVFNADGVLVASEYETREEGNIVIMANVTTVDAASNLLVVLGKTLSINASTVMEDDRNDGIAPVRYFSISDLRGVDASAAYNGDWVELKVRDDNGIFRVTELVRESDPATGKVALEGPAGVTGTTVTSIAGIPVECSANVKCSDVYLDGDIVQSTGSFNNNLLTVGVSDNF